jgi:phage terminase large subunit-like protein
MTASRPSRQPPTGCGIDSRAKRIRALQGTTLVEQAAASWLWEFEGRGDQFAPGGDWRTWLILAGRGWGKTRTGGAWVQRIAETVQGARIALVARTASDARDVMIEGESGILAKAPPWCRPRYEPSKRRLRWPTGAIATTFSAEEPDLLRGPQFTHAWCDELAAWDGSDKKRGPDAWDMLMMGLRLGASPQAVVTTTPRPIPILRELIVADTTRITRGATRDNRDNLAPAYLTQILAKYEGTRLGRQELDGELLDAVEGALWSHELIDNARLRSAPTLRRIVVAVDPAGSAKKTADETGIVVAGVGECFCKGGEKPEMHGFVLEDLSGKYSPEEMARKAVGAYRARKADRIVAEDNFGGQIIADLVGLVDRTASYKAVHASRGKIVRAEPVAALYEQGKVHHIGGLPKLEDELCTYTPLVPTSPGRLDALVWAMTDLMVDGVAMPIKAPDVRPPTYRLASGSRGF